MPSCSPVHPSLPRDQAPEQFSKRVFGPVGPKADVWALAATGLHLLTGAPPFEGEGLMDVSDMLVNARQAPPVPAGLPPRLAALLAACLTLSPGGRPTTAETLALLEAARREAEVMPAASQPAAAAVVAVPSLALCPGGHELSLVPLDNRFCDACCAKGLTTMHACRDCDFDLCATCFEALRKDGTRGSLFLAARYGDADAVRALLDAGADVTSTCEDGRTPLHVAAAHGSADAVRTLLDAGADVMSTCEDGLTPLHLASEHGKADALRTLLDAGADVNSTCEDGRTPLHAAAASGKADAVRTLLDAGGDVKSTCEGGWTPLHMAAADGGIDAVRALLDAGADVKSTCEDGRTPLHTAAAHGDAVAVRALLTAGGDVKSTCEGGWTPLHLAAASDEIDAVRALLDASADVHATGSDGQTALAARRDKHDAIAELLRTAGALG